MKSSPQERRLIHMNVDINYLNSFIASKDFQACLKHKSELSSGAETLKIESEIITKNNSHIIDSDVKNGKLINITIRKRRKTKSANDNRKYSCNICQRLYFSYPALYTHKRNKHNVIPITGKQDIFKNSKKDIYINASETSHVVKYKYSAVENIQEGISFTMKDIKIIYKEALRSIYCKEESFLFKCGYDINSHEGFILLNIFEESNEGIFLQSITSGNILQKSNIDDVFIIYLINFFKVTGKLTDLNILVVKFVILFREYLNIAGWSYKKTFIKYGVAMPSSLNGSYTKCNDCQEIPDLINDFVSVFIKMDLNLFDINLKKLLDIIKNFCNWLFVNNLTNFKITENE